jgi:catechol 2,3-dioxygenase-like lactoylglutathione lyase family enzyme
MLLRIKNTNVLVQDYDQAVKFYTEKLGFELYQNFPDQHWVALILPGSKEHIVTFCLAVEQSDKELVGRQTGSYPLFILEADDCATLYKEWKDKGVEFIGDMTTYGKGRFVIAKDLYGNKIFVSDSSVVKKD